MRDELQGTWSVNQLKRAFEESLGTHSCIMILPFLVLKHHLLVRFLLRCLVHFTKMNPLHMCMII